MNATPIIPFPNFVKLYDGGFVNLANVSHFKIDNSPDFVKNESAKMQLWIYVTGSHEPAFVLGVDSLDEALGLLGLGRSSGIIQPR